MFQELDSPLHSSRSIWLFRQARHYVTQVEIHILPGRLYWISYVLLNKQIEIFRNFSRIFRWRLLLLLKFFWRKLNDTLTEPGFRLYCLAYQQCREFRHLHDLLGCCPDHRKLQYLWTVFFIYLGRLNKETHCNFWLLESQNHW